MNLITHHTLYQWDSRNFPSCFLFWRCIHACRNRWKPLASRILSPCTLSSTRSSSVTLTNQSLTVQTARLSRAQTVSWAWRIQLVRAGWLCWVMELLDSAGVSAVKRENEKYAEVYKSFTATEPSKFNGPAVLVRWRRPVWCHSSLS